MKIENKKNIKTASAVSEKAPIIGCVKVGYALLTGETSNKPTYSDIRVLKGSQSFGLKPVENLLEYYADNSLVLKQSSLTSYELTLELTDLDKQANIDILGYKENATGGLYLTDSCTGKQIALVGAFIRADNTLDIITLYNCKINPNEFSVKNGQGKVDCQYKSYAGSAIPVNNAGENLIVDIEYLEANADLTRYFTSIQVPSKPTPPQS